jgi:NDP-sugar pyrophosphorylase family protein
VWKEFWQDAMVFSMKGTEPGYFFNLDEFSHRVLFENSPFVWNALDQLESYLAKFPLGKIEGTVSKDAYLINPELITIGAGSIVEPGAYIMGPCIIGKECQVRHGAYIRGNVIVGDRCVVGHTTEMKGSIMLNDAHAAHFAYVGDSILGNKVNLGAGTVLANLRLDRKKVAVLVDGKRVDTGRKKLGAILGDRAQTGCNAVLNPGTLFKPDQTCLPCVRC